ncbi:MAG TPA: outer membrane beta-barrel protein [Kofleriaceae bacterium]|nr:outer membrane beta-barrel protein [Kofleriaceae bacterium]
MRASRLVPVLALLLAGSGGIAHADGGYVGAGLGPGAGLAGNISTAFDTDDSMNARLAIGQRLGPVALEASLFGAGMIGRNDFAGPGREYDTVSLGVDLKYLIGILATPLEIYPKIGLNRTWLTGGRDTLDYDGWGWDLGAGAQLDFDRIAVWLDFTHQRTNLRSDNDAYTRHLDGRLNLLALGVSVYF